MKKALVLLIVLGLAGCGSNQPAGTSSPASKDLKPAPDFELENVAGGMIKSADIKGKVAVIDFWATWCEPCISEIPNYNALHETHDGNGVQMLGITVESGPLKDIKPKVEGFKMKYPVVVGDDKVVAGFGGLIGFPTTYIVTKDWKIYKRYLGITSKKRDLIEKDLAKLLAEPGPAT